MHTDEHTNQPNIRTGNEIISGAGNEDQLDRLNPAEHNVKAEQNGTPPSTGDEHLEAAKKTDKQPAQKNKADAEQETIAEKSGDVDNLGGATNLSIDQLKKEGDNNR